MSHLLDNYRYIGKTYVNSMTGVRARCYLVLGDKIDLFLCWWKTGKPRKNMTRITQLDGETSLLEEIFGELHWKNERKLVLEWKDKTALWEIDTSDNPKRKKRSVFRHSLYRERGKDAEGLFELARMYRNGKYLPVNHKKALGLLRRSKDLGFSKAAPELKRCERDFEDEREKRIIFYPQELAAVKYLDPVMEPFFRISHKRYWPDICASYSNDDFEIELIGEPQLFPCLCRTEIKPDGTPGKRRYFKSEEISPELELVQKTYGKFYDLDFEELISMFRERALSDLINEGVRRIARWCESNLIKNNPGGVAGT